MDAEGTVVAQHNKARTVEAFAETAQSAKTYLLLQDQAEAGDPAAKVKLFLAQLDLGMLGYEEAKAKLDELSALPQFSKHVSAEEAAALGQKLVNLEFDELLQNVPRAGGREKMIEAAAEGILAMRKEGRVPDGDAGMTFWHVLMLYAEQTDKLVLLEDAAAAWKKRLNPDDRRHARVIADIDRRVAAAKDK